MVCSQATVLDLAVTFFLSLLRIETDMNCHIPIPLQRGTRLVADQIEKGIPLNLQSPAHVYLHSNDLYLPI